MPLAARTTDNHVCPLHGGGPIVASPHTVTCEGLTIAIGGDRCTCAGPTDAIVTGADTVRVGGQPVARATSLSMHGGTLGPPLATTVNVGGPAGGAMVGNRRGALATCQQAATGRTSGSTQQSFGNCGVEASRQIINRARSNQGQAPIGEVPLLNGAIANNEASSSTTTIQHGSSGIAGNQRTLARNGVPSHVVPGGRSDATIAAIQQATAEGRGVITEHNAGALWGTTHTGGHAITVVGVIYDAQGHPTSIVTNDTGVSPPGNCLRTVPVTQFRNSLKPNGSMVVTDNPIW